MIKFAPDFFLLHHAMVEWFGFNELRCSWMGVEKIKKILFRDRKIHVAKENYCAFEGNELCLYADMLVHGKL